MAFDAMENIKMFTQSWKHRELKLYFFVEMTSPCTGGNTQKKNFSMPSETRGIFINQIKEDEIRKELYERERKAQENWVRKWGFLKNPKNLWNIEAVKRGLLSDMDLFKQMHSRNKSPSYPEAKNCKIVFLPSREFPQKSSGMIGWRLFSKENNLNLLAGPLYVPRKQTMNPPLSPEEPDQHSQRVIFLG